MPTAELIAYLWGKPHKYLVTEVLSGDDRKRVQEKLGFIFFLYIPRNNKEEMKICSQISRTNIVEMLVLEIDL